MRTRFDEKLIELNNSLIRMSAQVEHSISLATKALIEQDQDMAQEAIDADERVNELEKEIESLCLKLILQQQPIATDLRQISTALKMITDIERIGDHAADISEITLLLANEQFITKMDLISQMAAETTKMLTNSIDAYVSKDLDLAKAVIKHDDIVDDLFANVKLDLIQLIREDSSYGEQALNLLMIAKYFECIGDHAVNIAEWVIFCITGIHRNNRIL